MSIRPLLFCLVVAASPASAQCLTSFDGDYLCAYGCRATDANPRIEVAGQEARCWNELGGLFLGRLRPPDGIDCFRKLGTISCDGTTILWSDGVIWKRH